MQINDGWATEYNRKRWGIVLEDSDWESLLTDAGIPPGTNVPLRGKYAFLKLQAAVFSLEALAEYLNDNRDAGDVSAVHAELGGKRKELAEWLTALKEKYAS